MYDNAEKKAFRNSAHTHTHNGVDPNLTSWTKGKVTEREREKEREQIIKKNGGRSVDVKKKRKRERERENALHSEMGRGVRVAKAERK